jgi:hypothetical protein
MPNPINYMSKPLPTPPHDPKLNNYAVELQSMLGGATKFQRSGPINIRKVRPDEVGTTLVTYIKDIKTDLPKIEGEGVTLLEGMFVLRNPTPIGTAHGEPLYNEYVSNDLVYMKKNYGENTVAELTTEFQLKRKKGQFQAVKITEEMFQQFVKLGCVDKEGRIHIAVDFEPYVMYAFKGGWLNSSGYAIGEEEMAKNYEPILAIADALISHGLLAANGSTATDPTSTPSKCSQANPYNQDY